MKSISNSLHELIIELQTLDPLKLFSLAGGTSLALRLNHRKSVDIDLFTKGIIGIDGFKEIKKQIQHLFKDDLIFSEIENVEIGGQFCFLKSLIRKDKEVIKVEILQNFQHLDEIEIYQGIRVFTLKDIGLFKLMSASNRKAKKDIYDLDHITDQIPLSELMNYLRIKTEKYNSDEYRCLFDLDDEKSPSDDLNLLLAFDDINYTAIPSKPSHSNDYIETNKNSKTWLSAKTSWRKKVHSFMREQGHPIPPTKPIN